MIHNYDPAHHGSLAFIDLKIRNKMTQKTSLRTTQSLRMVRVRAGLPTVYNRFINYHSIIGTNCKLVRLTLFVTFRDTGKTRVLCTRNMTDLPKRIFELLSIRDR